LLGDGCYPVYFKKHLRTFFGGHFVELYTLKNTSGLFFEGHFVELLDKIWWTKKSKIEAEKRLLANAFQAQILLLWYSFVSVAAL
jgi:hypothetical protein